MTKKMTFSLPIELLNDLDKYSKKSLIPKSRLVQKAIKELLEKEDK